MGDRSAIEWTDATWNPASGCSKVSPGCANCYAEALSLRRKWTTKPWTAPNATENVVAHEERLDQPLRWRRPRRVFVNSMSDLFHEQLPTPFIDCVFGIMALASQHTFQVLTKRPARMLAWFQRRRTVEHYIAEAEAATIGETVNRIWRRAEGLSWPLPNVWLGVSVEDQRRADERIPWLLQTPAAVRFISAEPLLDCLDLAGFLPKPPGWQFYPMACRHGHDACPLCDRDPDPGLGWVIVGGESGPGARYMDLRWARSLIEQCRAASVPVFVKQLGRAPYNHDCDEAECADLILKLRDRKGGDPEEWPADLRVREFPR